MASSSSHSAPSSFYHVFLSFRGGDTRKNFVDHLYSALAIDRPIIVYKDDKNLPRGETIRPALFQAIEQSKIAVVVFSKNYADSSWCLDELSHIMKCRDKNGLIVMPIFYDVEPSDVRKRKRDFGEAFAKQEANNVNKADSWRKALFDASNIAGWEPKHFADGHESELIKGIVDTVLKNMSFSGSQDVDEGLVGMRDRVDELISKLKLDSSGVRMVGIWGVGGGGKTTLATSVFKEIYSQFKGHCIVENVREEFNKGNLEKLQNKILKTMFRVNMEVPSVTEGKTMIKRMLCRSKVLVVLDDIDDSRQLEALAGSHDWFGSGSRVIITTRDEHLLLKHKVDHVSHVRLLAHDEASSLFKKYAYREENVINDYVILSSRVVYYAHGLPLALRVAGSFLCDKNNVEWESYLEMLERTPDAEVMDILRISYEGLKNYQKELFLDIACFFRGKEKRDAMEILDAFGFNPDIGIKVLEQRALITFVNDYFQMHDLIQEMGHLIVRGENGKYPENHSRVWKQDEIRDMDETTENDKIEAIYCYGHSHSCEILSKMKKLRWLTVKRVDNRFAYYFVDDDVEDVDYEEYVEGNNDDGEDDNDDNGNDDDNDVDDDDDDDDDNDNDNDDNKEDKDDVEHLKGPDFLSNELQCIIWEDYPVNSFPDSFKAIKLVVLRLYYSLQKQLWNDIDKHLPRLKVLELCSAKKLLDTPNFNHLPCLQRLTFYRCDELIEIHPSLGYHKKLERIRVEGCPKFRMFPAIVQMKSLKYLFIHKYPELLKFPVIRSKMESLEELYLQYVQIQVLPSSIGDCCTNLIQLFIHGCSKLTTMEFQLDALKHLKTFSCSGVSFQLNTTGLFDQVQDGLRVLNFIDCHLNDGDIPFDISQLFNLQSLNLSFNDFSKLPSTISQLTKLRVLDLRNCRNLLKLPSTISQLVQLKVLIIGDCINLEIFPEFPSSLAVLLADGCPKITSIGDSITNCKCLCDVRITDGSILTDFDRLFDSMIQGKDSGNCIWSLQLEGLVEIPNSMVRPKDILNGKRYILQLPENWCYYNCGFIMYAVLPRGTLVDVEITMRQVTGNSSGMDYQDDVVRKKSIMNDEVTWVGYVPFSSLRHTSWWDVTCGQVSFEIVNIYINGRNKYYYPKCR
ncbi:disease resistance protein Roq1-like isoform X2 [Rutidosis leptorrhynchoides]|uniref:disease resistance protein Roq1-like isoform X2 n=1 Tax=Rutidosis leptorrhynchoides TaxID=125765 RepID=UPI003A9A0318